ncbi:gamma-glutamyl-gamma-aminobutyrate hydrolase family protein [Rugamonas sp. CCM 8940]|uniref:glutamine amidotransferase-related protein n=1 Tax=Rugamonas sp. CCM 8940 TaxID=2765359 RepID=UPI003615AF32
MRCLIIDNYDSFTWNLADYVSQIYGEEPLVIYNDQYTWDEICSLQEFGSIIISPGPGSVVNHGDFQVSRHALEQNDIPVLGVCLGMQGLAHIYGARIEAAPVPYHGRTSTIRHHGGALFEGIPAGFEAVRYHSLCVARESVPPSLRVTAQLDCGLVMALEHTRHPKWGVQFHPESILSEHGIQLMSNFRNLAYRHAGVAVPAPRTMVGARGLAPHAETAGQALAVTRKRLLSRKIDRLADAEAVFLKLYAEQEHCFWLDSQNVIDGMSRYSFMGAVNKEQVLTYRNGSPDKGPGAGEDFIATLDQYLEATKVEADTELPFEFRGGYVGFMTYEMRAVFGQTVTKTNLLPDAIWMRAERFIAFDHVSGAAWLLGIDDPAHPARSKPGWMTPRHAWPSPSPARARAPQPRRTWGSTPWTSTSISTATNTSRRSPAARKRSSPGNPTKSA